ncbi:MAG: type II/IV secretion system protein [wastewater metagenome]|nr:type II/IV secretion system protein [Candidatus Loosdrechtia aerotolerans]
MGPLTYKIDEILLSSGIVNQTQIDTAKGIQKEESIRLEDAIVKLGYASYSEILRALALYHDLAVIDLDQVTISDEVVNVLPLELIKKHQIIPISKENDVVTIAVSTPPDIEFIDNLRFILNANVKCVITTPENIEKTIHRYYGQKPTDAVDILLKELTTRKTSFNEISIEQIDESSYESKDIEDEGPIIQLVSLVINKAIASRASDIHVEPFSNRVRIRYRIDGVCQEAEVLPKRLQDPIISRIKILANIDIAEKRRPQDGRIGLKYAGKEFDVRVSCLPSIYGESVVMRLLEKTDVLMNVKNLGLYKGDYKRFRSVIKRPNGILLITGPTGSGKTTTLYAVINELNKTDTKIVTAEDPVEYTLSGINQSEVNEKIGFSFPAILRSMLRQDPNIILVGEIRDAETADIAVAAALTGHLVLSTLHTNDAPSAITRLIDMGVKPFLIATSLQGIMAQRLVRKICSHCKEPVHYTPQQLREMGVEIKNGNDLLFYKGKGCKNCNNIGYRGRIGIYELIDMNDILRDMAYRMAPTDEIRHVARKMGMTTIKEDGLKKAKDGLTTLDEVFAVTGMED